MSTPYTPTTEEVRDKFLDSWDYYHDQPYGDEHDFAQGEAFDRWLAAHEQKVLTRYEENRTPKLQIVSIEGASAPECLSAHEASIRAEERERCAKVAFDWATDRAGRDMPGHGDMLHPRSAPRLRRSFRAMTTPTCDGWCIESGSIGTVTHIGSKGYVYCAACAVRRRQSGYEQTRKMRAWELELINNGKQLPSYRPTTKKEANA